MSHPDFETRLQSLRPLPLPENWRAEILHHARAAATPPRRSALLPPRWLMAGWGLAWAAVLLLHLATPQEQPAAFTVAARVEFAPALSSRAAVMQSLLASNLDVPTLARP
jgi:hypothetical protein